MKKLYSFISFMFCALTMNAQTTTILSEGFDEGKPSSAPSSETTVTLASGEWKFKSVAVAKDQSNYRAKMSGNSYFILPVLDKPTGLAFDHRASNFDWVEASGSFQGNGNGIKLGGNGSGGSSKGKHEAWNCIAFNCNKTNSVKGFDQNSHGDGVKLVNCLAFGNGYDFMFEKSDKDCEYYNNVCLGRYEIKGGVNSNNAVVKGGGGKGGWDVVESDFSMLDYNSLDEADAKAPRGADGSMPKGFARLVSGSKLIDRGLDLSHSAGADYPFLVQPICGNARDLGSYEYEDAATGIAQQMIFTRDAKLSVKANSNAITFTTANAGTANVIVRTLSGSTVWQRRGIAVERSAEYAIPFSAQLNGGIYIITVENGNSKVSNKFSL